VFDRDGDALWGDFIGDCIAMSPAGDKVAFVSNMRRRQMPGALHCSGTLEVWDITSGKAQRFDVDAVDDQLAWLPDDRRLAFVKFVAPRDAGALPLLPDSFGSFYQSWEVVPAVHVLDTATGQMRLVHGGRRPVVSRDGTQLLVLGEAGQGTPGDAEYAYEQHWRLVDIDGPGSAPVELHGKGTPVALLDGGIYLAETYPTAGRPVRFTVHNSPLRGPKPMWSLKLARLGTNQFVTVVPYVDPRAQVYLSPASR
jgi:hypothetical protein